MPETCRATFDILVEHFQVLESSYHRFERAWEGGEWKFTKDDTRDGTVGRCFREAAGWHVILDVFTVSVGSSWALNQFAANEALRALHS
jgi:hypothetical protein